ncbi:unnamed protein product [Spodoptera exigua]|nr:unnamed protein product [Spodoptera exigua]
MDPEGTLVSKLNELLDAVRRGNIDNVKNIVNWFEQELNRNKALLPAVYAGARPCPTQADLIVAACSHNQKSILDYLLNETDILDHLIDNTQELELELKKRTNAVKHALRLGDFEMVEKMYNYWSGDLYWNGHEKDKFTNLGKILKDAEADCDVVLVMVSDQQLLINFKSLNTLNDFQQELYELLPQTLPHNASAKETAEVLLEVLCLYNKYSKIGRVRIPDVSDEIERQLKLDLEDETSTYYRAQAYIKYEVYFRKLDFNIAILLLEKLYIIRNHLKQRFNKSKTYFDENKKLFEQYKSAATTYKDIECAIFHLIYRTSEDWRLYLPADRKLTVEKHHVGIYNGVLIRNLKSTYDLHKLYNGPVLYFERDHFKTCIGKLKNILNDYFLTDDPITNQVNKENKEELLDENYLKPMMYVSDYYSLRKIVMYIEALEHTNDADIIMIERVLQVIGEMMKASEGSTHLSELTSTFLQTAISAETIKLLQQIREFLSHADKGQLSLRIDIENDRPDILRNVKEELVKIKEHIFPIFDICKSVLDKSLLQKGLDLLESRIKKMPFGARKRLDEISSLYKKHGINLVSISGQYFRDIWDPAGLPHQLLLEIPQLLVNRDDILAKKETIEKEIDDKVMKMLPQNIQNMKQLLKLMQKNNDIVDDINSQLIKYKIKELEYCPKAIDINDRKRKLEKKLKNKINFPEDFSQSWKSIQIMISYCPKHTNMFASTDTSAISGLSSLLEKMEVVCLMYNSRIAWFCGKQLAKWGLWIYKSFREMITRSETTSFIAIENLHKDAVLKVAQNSSGKGREELIKCLINRIDLLRTALGHPEQIPLREHVQRYKLDLEFRFMLEMLLTDIDNIINNKKYVSRKCNKLLEGIILRNVLDHGNPFLEVIGDVLDRHELPEELLSKAKSFAEDLEAVKALYALYQDNIDLATIKNGTLANMNETQKDLHSKLKQSQNWERYLCLIPSSHRRS